MSVTGLRTFSGSSGEFLYGLGPGVPETSFFVETETTRNVELLSHDLEERASRDLASQLPAQQAPQLLGLPGPRGRARCRPGRARLNPQPTSMKWPGFHKLMVWKEFHEKARNATANQAWEHAPGNPLSPRHGDGDPTVVRRCTKRGATVVQR